MLLKHQLDSLDGVDASLTEYYEKGADGKYFLQVQGMVAKGVVDEFRENNIRLNNQLKGFDGVDPTDYHRLKKLEKDFKGNPDQAAVDKAVQERVSTMKNEYEGKIRGYEASTGQMKSQLEVLVIDNSVRAAAIKTGVRPEAMDDVLLRAKTVFKFEEGKAVPYDSQGKPIFGKDASSHMTPEEWTTGLKKSAPHLFPQSSGTGASGPGNRGGPDTSKMSPTQKIAAGMEARDM